MIRILVFMQHSTVIEALGPSHGMVFLDLLWLGTVQGRVHIQLDLNLPVAKEFYLLCAGEKGEYLKDSRFQDVGKRGLPGEYVRWNLKGKFFEGAGVTSDRAGAVWLWSARGGSHVSITTRDGEFYPRVFGKVVSGLDVVQIAANLGNTQVIVGDLGIVLTV